MDDLDICWVQEEPRNKGAWTHVNSRIDQVLERLCKSGLKVNLKTRYIGRKEDAVPAVGVGKLFKEQQMTIMKESLAGI